MDNFNIPYADKYRILAIDPSTSHTGVSLLDLDLSTGNIFIVNAATFNRKDILNSSMWMVDVFGQREAAVAGYGKIMEELLHTWQPSGIVYESAYLSRLPQAFKALTEISVALRSAVMAWDCTVPFNPIDPSTVKKFMGVKGTSSNKDDMRIALLSTQLPVQYIDVIAEQLGEHEIDATCVGLWYADQIMASMQHI